MNREEKNQIIDDVLTDVNAFSHLYITDIGSLTVEDTNKFRRLCFEKNVKLKVVKNALLKKAFEKSGNSNFTGLYDVLAGPTAVMFCDTSNVPAKLIETFRKKFPKPLLKAAYVEESVYKGDNQIAILVNLKSKNELIGDVIALLQSPAKNVVSQLKSSGGKLAGILKTLEERAS
jgi:large subunit ribosomal protein L10